MTAFETRVLTGAEVARCLPHSECRDAIERALAARGPAHASRSVGFAVADGGFHVKAALREGDAPRFVAKVNGNFPANPRARGLPTIQGVLVLADASDGRPLAILDSATVTAIRTAATSAVAVRHLAACGASVAAIVGCGIQGRAHVDAFLALERFTEISVFDLDTARAEALAAAYRDAPIPVRAAPALGAALRSADVVATCTPGVDYVLRPGDVEPGTFVAAVGADAPRKREVHPDLLAGARVFVDDLEQCANGGDLHHALEAGVLSLDDVAGDLGAVVSGTVPHGAGGLDLRVFDSTGIALEDLAAAELAYQRALVEDVGARIRFGA